MFPPTRFALLDPRSFVGGQPHSQFQWLREHDPVHRHPEADGGPGYWAIASYDDVRSISRNHQVFSNEPSIMIADLLGIDLPGDARMMITSGPPYETQLRRLVSGAFTPRAAREMAPRIHKLSAQIVDQVIERGECDLVADVAGELPSYVIAELLGIPLEDGRKLYQLTEIIHSDKDSLPEGAQLARVEIDAMLSEILTRMQHLELTSEPEWLASNFISGPKTMPVRFRLGRRRHAESRVKSA